jgi:hypothetical protein
MSCLCAQVDERGEPLMIVDPNPENVRPDDWSDEDDGEWEPNFIEVGPDDRPTCPRCPAVTALSAPWYPHFTTTLRVATITEWALAARAPPPPLPLRHRVAAEPRLHLEGTARPQPQVPRPAGASRLFRHRGAQGDAMGGAGAGRDGRARAGAALRACAPGAAAARWGNN